MFRKSLSTNLYYKVIKATVIKGEKCAEWQSMSVIWENDKIENAERTIQGVSKLKTRGSTGHIGGIKVGKSKENEEKAMMDG